MNDEFWKLSLLTLLASGDLLSAENLCKSHVPTMLKSDGSVFIGR